MILTGAPVRSINSIQESLLVGVILNYGPAHRQKLIAYFANYLPFIRQEFLLLPQCFSIFEIVKGKE